MNPPGLPEYPAPARGILSLVLGTIRLSECRHIVSAELAGWFATGCVETAMQRGLDAQGPCGCVEGDGHSATGTHARRNNIWAPEATLGEPQTTSWTHLARLAACGACLCLHLVECWPTSELKVDTILTKKLINL